MDPNFTSIPGQASVKKLLALALQRRQFSHAYLLEGPTDLGTEILARDFAAAILCTGENPPCRQCSSCRHVAAGTHQEFRWIQPDNPDKDTSLSVDTVRAMIKDIYMKPYEGDWKVYLIPRGEIMTFQAQNALLKTLEEPPDHAVIILITSQPEQLLPTVLSRCQRASFRPVSREETAAWLQERFELTPGRARQLAAYANGAPEKARRLLENEAVRQQREQFFRLTDTLAQGKLGPLLEAGAFLQSDKHTALEIIHMWQEWFRDLQVIMLQGEEALLINQDQQDRLKKQTEGLRTDAARKAQQLLEEAREDILNHGNLSFVTDMLLINLLDRCCRI